MPGMARVDRKTVDDMNGAVYAAIWGPGGIAYLLPRDGPDSEYQMLLDTEIVVQDEPSKKDIALVANEVGDSGVLLGLFTHPPAKIQLFASSILEVGYDPVDVATHELGHRFNYDHSLRPAAVTMVGRREGNAEARVLVSGDSCPVCLLHARLAEVMGLMDGLRKRAHLQHQIPQGLGGTIPLAAKKVAEARSSLALVANEFPNRQDEVKSLDALLAQMQNELNQWLTPEDVSRIHEQSIRAWDKAYDLNHQYWLQTMYGNAIEQGAAYSHSH